MPESTHMKSLQRVIDARLENGTLHCELAESISQAGPVNWTLHRGDLNPRRASAPVRSGAQWKVDLPDVTSGFMVQAEVAGNTYQSEWFQHYSAESVRQYNEWRSKIDFDQHARFAPIPLFRYEAPFVNIALVCHNQDLSSNLQSLAASSDLQLEQYPGVSWQRMSVMTSHRSVVDESGNRYIFSGLTRDVDRLLVGMDDVHEYVRDVSQLRDGVGEYHLLYWNDNEVSFSHDYIGQGHLFYYESDDTFVAANGLHLLALTLKSLGVRLKLNVSSAKGKFFSTSYPFETQQGLHTDFDGIFRVSVFDRIEINASGSTRVKTELWTDDADGDLTDEAYEDLLATAVQEIRDNVSIALKHPSFENVVVELSAGLDSRIVYSALTTLPPCGKVRVSTRRGAEEATAAAINNLYGFPWDDLARVASFDAGGESEALPQTSHSVFMDGYYIESMFKARENYAHPTLVLTGHGGEAFSRVMSTEGYFARDFSGSLPKPVDSFQEVYDNVVRYIGNHQVWLEAGKSYYPQTLADSLSESPSKEFGKAFADLYLTQRNPFIGGSVFRGAMYAPQWRPLHSKALFRLRALWLQRQQDYRLQYDLIRALNPLVSEVPYLKPLEVARKEEFERYRAPFKLKAPIEFDYSVETLSEARRQSSRRLVALPDRKTFDETRSAIREYENSAASFLDPLACILHLAPEMEDMGLPVYTYIQKVVNRTEPRKFSKRHNIRNKLHILMQEVLLTSGVDEADGGLRRSRTDG